MAKQMSISETLKRAEQLRETEAEAKKERRALVKDLRGARKFMDDAQRKRLAAASRGIVTRRPAKTETDA